MLSHREPEYREAREYKTGGREMALPFSLLADWIAEEFSVSRPLQIRLDHPSRRNGLVSYRLDVVFDEDGLDDLFRGSQRANFDKVKQGKIHRKFLELRGNQDSNPRPNWLQRLVGKGENPLPSLQQLDNLFVIFSSFERVAREEANAQIEKHQINELERMLKELGVWKIYPIFDIAHVMFNTDQQMAEAVSNGSADICEQRYAEVAAQYDEFGYLARRPIELRLGSKETFDRDYEGSWQYYCR